MNVVNVEAAQELDGAEDAVDTLAEMKRRFSPKRLRKAMAAKGWEVRDLAYHSGLSVPTIEALLEGTSNGRVDTFTKVIDALEVADVNSLFDVLTVR